MSREHYSQMEIRTASPAGVVAKLYEGAIRFCRTAVAHDEAGRSLERGQAIGRALAIVGELQNALDREQGGEIARNLDALYLFVGDRLLQANLSAGRGALEEAERVLVELHGAWDAVARGGTS